MTIDEARKVITRISYKPQWYIHCDVNIAPYVFRLHLERGDMPSVDPELPKGLLHYSAEIPIVGLDSMTEDHLIQWVFLIIQEFEQHEMLEWFKLDGKHIKPPHATVKQ